ncbi:MAG: hypothetical protein H7Y20_00520 [Bryobacteraceae bacterium]|nr:hypothetical protein [Bryobacteraceae bacterium]
MFWFLILLSATALAADQPGMRFFPQKEINRTNVSTLRAAWTFRTGEGGFMLERRMGGWCR